MTFFSTVPLGQVNMIMKHKNVSHNIEVHSRATQTKPCKGSLLSCWKKIYFFAKGMLNKQKVYVILNSIATLFRRNDNNFCQCIFWSNVWGIQTVELLRYINVK